MTMKSNLTAAPQGEEDAKAAARRELQMQRQQPQDPKSVINVGNSVAQEDMPGYQESQAVKDAFARTVAKNQMEEANETTFMDVLNPIAMINSLVPGGGILNAFTKMFDSDNTA